MTGFLSKESDPKVKVKKTEIFFIFCPERSSTEEIKMHCASKAKLFADTLKVNEVYLHFGKEIIKYEFSV